MGFISGLVLVTFGFQTATSNRSQANPNQENKNTTKQPVGQMKRPGGMREAIEYAVTRGP